MGTRPARAARRFAGAFALATFAAVAALSTFAAPSALAAAPGKKPAPLHASLDAYPQADLDVRSGTATHRFRVWIADTYERREQGLMWIRKLPANRGMLFIFDQPQLTSFWMKNTYVRLDLLFIAADGRVIRIAENAEPHSLANIDSMGYVTGVLEIAGGTSKKLGLRTGDYVLHPAFARR